METSDNSVGKKILGFFLFIAAVVVIIMALAWWFGDSSPTPPPFNPDPPAPGPGPIPPNPTPVPPDDDFEGYKRVSVRRVLDAVTFKLDVQLRDSKLYESEYFKDLSDQQKEDLTTVTKDALSQQDYEMWVQYVDNTGKQIGVIIEEDIVVEGILAPYIIKVKLDDGTDLCQRLYSMVAPNKPDKLTIEPE